MNFLGLCTRWQLGDGGVSIPLVVRPPSWTWGDCNGGENDEKNNGQNGGNMT